MAETKPIPIRLRRVTLAYLRDLVRSRAYGETRSDVIRRFIDDGIASAIGRVIEKQDIGAHGEDLDKATES